MGTYGNVRVPGISLGICGREDGVDKNKGTNNLSTETRAFRVASGQSVSTTTVTFVVGGLKGLG